MKNKVLYKAENRGHANHGWLNTYHTFSFAGYMNPERMNFGVLRVLNDDTVAGGRGFGMHPHDNMEIISIPTSGSLEHKDNMGNGGIINTGDIQGMTAGTGVQHSEFNPSANEESKFFQIWLFPREFGLEPRYEQIETKKEDRENKWDQIVSPNKEDKGISINQDAWFHLADLAEGKVLTYDLKKEGNGLFLFVIEGEAEIDDIILNRRDALGFWSENKFEVKATKNSKLLLMEVPMELPSYLRK